MQEGRLPPLLLLLLLGIFRREGGREGGKEGGREEGLVCIKGWMGG